MAPLTCLAQTSHSSQAPPRPHSSPAPSLGSHSLTPSPRRERAPLRSSPLAGPSYASDGSGGIVQHSSALDEEIARRRSHLLVGLDDAERARLASLSHSPSVSVEVSPAPSRKNSTSDSCGESAGHAGEKRRARPSFISLAPPGSPVHSTQLPGPPPLRNRHSSPNIARAALLDAPLPPLPTTPTSDKGSNSNANWMTSTPSPSFSRTAIHSKGVVLPVKADSKSARRIRHKSMPSAPASSRHFSKSAIPALPGTHIIPSQQNDQGQSEIAPRGQGQSIRPKKSTLSLRSVRSLGRMFRHEHPHDEKDNGLVPPLPVPLLPTPSRSRTSSIGSATSVRIPLTPPDGAVFVPGSGPVLEVTSGSPPAPVIDETREGKVKRLWAKVTHGIKRMK